MSLGTILIRADASVRIGTGHVMRCLALAQAWQDQGGNAVFALAESTPAILARLIAGGCEVMSIHASPGTPEDACCTVELAEARSARWIVADGYSFDADYQRRMKDAGRNLLCIDDNATVSHFSSDLVLNQNLHACESLYAKREPVTKLLLGPKFAMLRREFRAWQRWRREIPSLALRVLVTMGGSDADNLSERVIQALSLLDIKGLKATVVAGGSNPHIQRLKAMAERSHGTTRVEVDSNNMPELMAQADLAISSAGSTCWEMCALGLPAIVIDIAQNQIPLARKLASERICIYVPAMQATAQRLAEEIELLVRSSDRRSLMSRRALELVDGNGAARVVAAMRAQGITMRRAYATDCHLTWEWANDPVVRQASFSSSEISWQEHTDWFTRKLRDPGALFLIFEDESGSPMGSVRVCPTTHSDAEISVTLASQCRGGGLASYLLEKAAQRAFEHMKLQRVHAFIKPENRASSKSFENAGFFLMGTTRVKGDEALHYIRAQNSSLENGSTPHSRLAAEMVRCK
jgi:UDP-2,4-diacetamido-2,4,6-trideoxy-beta-L-altropyranose hydrolase